MALLDNAQKDSLTRCYAKEVLMPYLEKVRAEYTAYNKPFTIIVIDIDGFKAFNDKQGHIFGDEALRYFSSSLRLNLEDEDCVIVRFGGDEFVVVFPGRVSKEVYRLAVHIEKNMRKRPFLFRGREYKMSFSCGIATCPHDGTETQDVLDRADKAMYFSKRYGTGKVTQYSKMGSEFIKRVIKVIAVIAAILGIAIIATRIFNIDTTAIRKKMTILRKATASFKDSSRVKVHLRSGNSIEGVMTGENDKEMFLRFDMAEGEGAVVIKKSEIQSIDRR
jgi:diguanylate cyclase (GGDEF)-like protein